LPTPMAVRFGTGLRCSSARAGYGPGKTALAKLMTAEKEQIDTHRART
jgi:hypothetical protein